MSQYKELYIDNFPMQFEAYCNDTKIYGKRIRKERERISTERGKTYTVRDLAADLGIKHSTVTKIENGNRCKINIGYLNLMCNLFNCSYLYLLGKSNYRTASTTNYCFPNPRNNTELLKMIISLGNIFYINNEMVTSSNYVLGMIIDKARSNPKGITVRNKSKKYKIYYFLKENLIKQKNSNILTQAENSNDFTMEEEYLNIHPRIEEELYQNKSIYDIIIIQDCTAKNDMIHYTEPEKDDNALYRLKLQSLFIEDWVHVKNYNLLDFLYAIRNIEEINNSEILCELTKIFRDDNFSDDDIYSLIQIITNYNNADSDKRKAILSSSYK